jgi:hypothetical protein
MPRLNPPTSVRPRIRVGDVFLLPLDESQCQIGQVVGTYLSAFYLAVFDRLTEPSAPSVDEALRSGVILLALALDAKLSLGHWPIVTNRPVPDDVKLPAYKVAIGSPDEIYVEDFTGTRRRLATPQEVNLLRHRSVTAPIRLEKAARARLGLETWRDDYQDLIPDEAQTTDALFP